MLNAFRWFGTYLAWIPDEFAKTSIDGRGIINIKRLLIFLCFIHFSDLVIYVFMYLFIYYYKHTYAEVFFGMRSFSVQISL